MTSTKTIKLPFFPNYEIEYLLKDTVRLIWFESRFSQSHYNIHNKTKESNACTLIAVLMSANCYKSHINIDISDGVTVQLIHLLALSMLQGNEIHEKLKQTGVLQYINLNIPEALKYTQDKTMNLVEWRSLIFMEHLSVSLCYNIQKNYLDWIGLYKEPEENLYAILIADNRTVMFLLQPRTDTVTLFDSHQYSIEKGALIMTVYFNRLDCLCYLYQQILKQYFKSDPKLYELSFLCVIPKQDCLYPV